MKLKRVFMSSFSVIALLMLGYCLTAYVTIQPKLTNEMLKPSQTIISLGNMTVIALFIVGLYHVALLVNALKALTARTKNSFYDSVYIVLIILSGLTLLSDFILLSEIGKEYRYWDVQSQWWILYGFTAFHTAVVIGGAIASRRNEANSIRLFQAIKNGGDALFVSIHQIAFITGLLGLLGVVFAMTGIVVPLRYSIEYMILLAGLAVFPFVFIVIFSIIKLRKQPLGQWFDEKQFSDTAFGALTGVICAMPLYLIIAWLDVTQTILLPVPFWMLLVFFIQMVIFTLPIMLKNRDGAV